MGGSRSAPAYTPPPAPVPEPVKKPEAASAISARKRLAEERADTSSTDGATKKLLGN